MIGLLAFVVLVLDVIALATIVQSSMPVGKKVLWALIVVVLPVGGTPLYFAFGQKT